MGILAQLSYIMASSLDMLPEPASLEVAAETGSAKALANVLFTEYVLPFEAIGILLLAATIGAVVLAKRRPV